MRRLQLVAMALALLLVAGRATGEIQIIHNAPGPGVAVVDLHIPEVQGGLVASIPDVGFREATALEDLGIASRAYFLSVVEPGSPWPQHEHLHIERFVVLDPGTPLVPMLLGLLNDGRFAFGSSEMPGLPGPGEMVLKAWHGTPDAPEIDLGPLLSDLTYPEPGPVDVTVPADDSSLEVIRTDPGSLLETDTPPLATLSDSTRVGFTSGFLTGAPALQLPGATANGDVIEFDPVNALETRSWGRLKGTFR
jgi:hypothetical protein